MKVTPAIESLIPYKAGKPISETQREFGISRVIKLASNENALGVSPKVLRAIESAQKELVFRYPDPSCYELVQTISRKWNVEPSKIAIGNGSNELIDLIIRTFSQPGYAIVIPQFSFIAYQLCAQAFGVTTLSVPVDEKMKVSLEDIFRSVKNHSKAKIVFIANPNNPTGSLISSQDLKSFVFKMQNELPDVLIVLDEAYHEYVTSPLYESAIQWTKDFSNIIVLRTFSKVFGLAGLRIGAMVGSKTAVDYVQRVRNPFNVNELAQVAAIAALEDENFLNQTVKLNSQEYLKFQKAFEQWKIPFFESHGNFILIDTLGEAEIVYQSLLKVGIILRPVGNYGLKNHLRVSIGTQAENEEAIRNIIEVMKALGRIKDQESASKFEHSRNQDGKSNYN